MSTTTSTTADTADQRAARIERDRRDATHLEAMRGTNAETRIIPSVYGLTTYRDRRLSPFAAYQLVRARMLLLNGATLLVIPRDGGGSRVPFTAHVLRHRAYGMRPDAADAVGIDGVTVALIETGFVTARRGDYGHAVYGGAMSTTSGVADTLAHVLGIDRADIDTSTL